MRGALAVATVALLTTACKPAANAIQDSPHPDATTVPATGSCHRGGTLTEPTPDPRCTPGVTNPDVTPGTINQTICKSGWTSTIRPPASYTNALKKQGITDYGYTDTNPRDYEEDHLLSGAPTETVDVCAGQSVSGMPLARNV